MTRVPTRRLVREFQWGRSFLGLARKFGLTRAQVEARIRAWMRAHPGRPR